MKWYKKLHFKTSDGIQKPDFVAIIGTSTLFIDTQIVNE